jgi:hypothetical protein
MADSKDPGHQKTLEMRVAELEDRLSQMHISEEEMQVYQKVASKLGAAPCQQCSQPCVAAQQQQQPCVAAQAAQQPCIASQQQAAIYPYYYRCYYFNCYYRPIYYQDCILGPMSGGGGGGAGGGGGFGGFGM